MDMSPTRVTGEIQSNPITRGPSGLVEGLVMVKMSPDAGLGNGSLRPQIPLAAKGRAL